MRPSGFLLVLAIMAGWTSYALAQTNSPQSGAPMPTVAGWIETVTFPDYGLTLDAKLDTGAVSSSLGVSDLERFKHKGKTWYRFTMRGADGKAVTIEQQSNRVVRVRRAEVETTARPVIRLKVCVAGHAVLTDFNLTDRSGQDYQVLIGRKFMAGRVLVDSGREKLFANPCEVGK